MPIINSVTAGRGTKPPQLYETEVVPTSFPTIVEPPEEADGWSKVTVLAPDNLEAGNIRKGVTIAGVEGIYEQIPNLQKDKHVKPEAFPLDVQADAGYAGLENAVIETPDNLEAENIKNGVTIAGVEGTYTGDPLNTLFNQLARGTITSVTASDLEGVTKLRPYFFFRCTGLTSATLPDTITRIGQYAFYGVTGIKDFEMPDSVTEVGEACFIDFECDTFKLSNNLKSIPNYMFQDAWISSQVLSVPASVENISGFYNFDFNFFKLPVNVKMNSPEPPVLEQTFSVFTSKSIIIVPKGSLDAYKTATNWTAYADQMQEAEE